MPIHTTVSAFLMVMPLTAGIATGLIAFTAGTAIVRAITVIMVIDRRAITTTDIVRVITAEAGEAIAGPAMAGEAQVGRDMKVGRARAFRDTAGAEAREAAGEEEDIESEIMSQASCQNNSPGKARYGTLSSILINKEMAMAPGRLSIASMMLPVLFLSEGAIARDDVHRSDRSADVNGSGRELNLSL